jgi:hypothetical protein
MLSGIALLFALVVYLQRARWRGGQRRGRRVHFYPTNMMLGLALQNLQVFAHPEVDHILQEKYADEAEEDDEGDPDDPQKVLARQLRAHPQWRNGRPAAGAAVGEGKNAKTVMWSLLRRRKHRTKKKAPRNWGLSAKQLQPLMVAQPVMAASRKKLGADVPGSGGGPWFSATRPAPSWRTPEQRRTPAKRPRWRARYATAGRRSGLRCALCFGFRLPSSPASAASWQSRARDRRCP